MSGTGYLNSSWVWFLIAIVILILIVIWVKVTGRGGRDPTKTTAETRKETKVKYRRDTVPMVETLNDESLDDKTLEEVDLTPIIDQKFTDLSETSVSEEIIPEPKGRARSKGEIECHRVLEDIYKVPFDVQVRPDWLRNPRTGRCLELDVSELKNLKIAVEYNGRQHYQYVKQFHRNGVQDLKDQIYRDNVKLDLCDKNGVYLIVVPYNVAHHKIEDFIKYQLSKK